MKNTLGGKKLIVGSGPNQFVGEWLMSKPSAVNQTIFWNTDFNYGVGLIPTFIVTTGLLGIIAWLIFLLPILLTGFRAIFIRTSSSFPLYITISSLSVATFLWVLSILYVTNSVTFALAFLFTGLCVVSLVIEKVMPTKTIIFSK